MIALDIQQTTANLSDMQNAGQTQAIRPRGASGDNVRQRRRADVRSDTLPSRTGATEAQLGWRNRDQTGNSRGGRRAQTCEGEAYEAEVWPGTRFSPMSTRSPYPQSRPPNQEAQGILRVHYVSEILGDLRRLSRNAKQPSGIAFVHGVRSGIRAMVSTCPTDPFLDVLLALNDAISYEPAAWTQFSAEQYLDAHNLLSGLVNRTCSENVLGNAISKLEEIGFDTTPYGYTVDEEEEDA